jgi:hypothetical protein
VAGLGAVLPLPSTVTASPGLPSLSGIVRLPPELAVGSVGAAGAVTMIVTANGALVGSCY